MHSPKGAAGGTRWSAPNRNAAPFGAASPIRVPVCLPRGQALFDQLHSERLGRAWCLRRRRRPTVPLPRMSTNWPTRHDVAPLPPDSHSLRLLPWMYAPCSPVAFGRAGIAKLEVGEAREAIPEVAAVAAVELACRAAVVRRNLNLAVVRLGVVRRPAHARRTSGCSTICPLYSRTSSSTEPRARRRSSRRRR